MAQGFARRGCAAGRRAAIFAVFLLGGVMALGQSQDSPKPAPQQPPDQSPGQSQDHPTPGGDSQQQPPPTLGKRPEGETGPRTSTTTNPRRLLAMNAIYVEPIDNSVGLKLAEGLSRMGRFRIVTERKDADSVVSGTCFDSHRLKQVHTEVFISDRASGSSIWQDVVRVHYLPPPLNKAIDNTVAAVLQHLGESIREAERH